MSAPIITEAEARKSAVCVCGAPKDVGQVVCWPCFKEGPLPLKWYEGSFMVWQVATAKHRKQPATGADDALTALRALSQAVEGLDSLRDDESRADAYAAELAALAGAQEQARAILAKH